LIKRCKICPEKFECFGNGRNRKYCESCKLKIWKIQKRGWKRKKEYNTNCLECGISLEGMKIDRKRCNSCRDERIKKIKRELHRKKIGIKYMNNNIINCEVCNEIFYSVKGVRIHDKLVHRKQIKTSIITV
jgi:hypothetical protein